MKALPPRNNGGRTIQIQRSDFAGLAKSEGYGDQLIQRFDLEAGEELADFLDKLYMAVQKAEPDDRWYWLVAIYGDHIIIEDDMTGKYYRFDFARDENGDVVLSNQAEVMIQYVPVSDSMDSVQRSAGETSDREASAPVLRARIPDVQPKGSDAWSAILHGPKTK